MTAGPHRHDPVDELRGLARSIIRYGGPDAVRHNADPLLVGRKLHWMGAIGMTTSPEERPPSRTSSRAGAALSPMTTARPRPGPIWFAGHRLTCRRRGRDGRISRRRAHSRHRCRWDITSTCWPAVFVPGNHDVFDGPLNGFKPDLRGPVHVLPSGQSIIIGAARFVGATLWTDWDSMTRNSRRNPGRRGQCRNTQIYIETAKVVSSRRSTRPMPTTPIGWPSARNCGASMTVP